MIAPNAIKKPSPPNINVNQPTHMGALECNNTQPTKRRKHPKNNNQMLLLRDG